VAIAITNGCLSGEAVQALVQNAGIGNAVATSEATAASALFPEPK
jgi:hypothetical protein